MSYKLFLDDERIPAKVTWVELPLGPWVVVRNYQEFVDVITRDGLPEFITFDHDLADEHYPFNKPGMGPKQGDKIDYDKYKEKTGFDCAKWLVDYCIDNDRNLPKYAIHSKNTVGAENIRGLFENFLNFLEEELDK